jgi:hypothetical protein
VQRIVKESMEEALKRILPEVPFVAEIRVAASEVHTSGIRANRSLRVQTSCRTETDVGKTWK